jgi:hypothetical protein
VADRVRGWVGRLSTRRVRRGAVGLALCAGVVAVVGAGDGDPPARFDLRSGAAWVASSRVGLMTLIDGSSGQVAARVRVTEQASDLRAAQLGPTGYVVDRRAGTLARIDPATFVVGPPVEVIDGAAAGLSAHPTDDAVYVLDMERGQVASTDPDDVARVRGRPRSVAEEIGSSVVDDEGRLWMLGRSSGDVVWFDGAERQVRSGAVREPAGAELVVAGGQAVLVDRAARRVTELGDDGGPGDRACVDMDPGDETVRFGGSGRRARVYVVSGADGVLRVSDLDDGGCSDVVVTLADEGDELGPPQEVAGRVFVPNYTAGTVAVVDMATSEVRHTGELVPGDTAFELFGQDGIAFYNDPESQRAGVVRLDGSFVPVAKYDPADPDSGVEPREGRDQTPSESPTAPATDEPPDDAAESRPPRPDERGDPDDGSRPSGTTEVPVTTGSTGPPGTAAPAVGAITSDAGGAYLQGETVTFSASVTGTFTACTWTIDGATSPCAPPNGQGSTTVQATALLDRPGEVTVQVDVRGPGGPDDASLTINVAIVDPPAPTLSVAQPQVVREGFESLPYTFSALVTGAFNQCSWNLPGQPACEPAAGSGTTTVTGTGQFVEPGPADVTVSVSGPGVSDGATLHLDMTNVPHRARIDRAQSTLSNDHVVVVVNFSPLSDLSSVEVTADPWSYCDGVLHTGTDPNAAKQTFGPPSPATATWDLNFYSCLPGQTWEKVAFVRVNADWGSGATDGEGYQMPES